MPNKITHTQVYVLDQDEALDFYVGKLGFELNTDADLGFMRWLTVNFPASPTRAAAGEARPAGARRRDRRADPRARHEGRAGDGGDHRVDDIHKTYEELRRQGRRVHRGADGALLRHRLRLRDPFGNPLRIGTPK